MFNTSRGQVDAKLSELDVTSYAIKLLRHGLHVYCETVEDFKKVRDALKSANIQHYSHELEEEKHYKVVLTGLHKMEPNELIEELGRCELAPVAVRVISSRNAENRSDVLYVVSFPRGGTVTLNGLKKHKVVYHTRVDWQPYRHRGGIVQCTRCQRPGHGVKHCSMPPRCAHCGEGHETKSCPTTKTAVENASTDNNGPVEVPLPAKCCNCDTVGHFATDPNCPRRMQYIKMRRQRQNSGNRFANHQNQQEKSSLNAQYQPGGPSYADVVTKPIVNPSPSGYKGNSASSGPSGARPSCFSCPPGNISDQPFSFEEISALTCEIITSLRNVQHMPRHEAIGFQVCL